MEALDEHTIVFTGLKDGPHDYHFELGREFFEAAGKEDMDGGRVDVNVRLEKSPSMLMANIRLEGSVGTRCDHCDAPMELRVEGDQRQIFRLNATEDYDDEELTGLAPDAHSINLTHYLYECLCLALPARRTHAPGECDPETERAFARYASAQPAITHEPVPDPRWNALRQLRNPRP